MSDTQTVTGTINQAMVITAKGMYKERIITKKQYVDFITHHRIVPSGGNWFGKLIQKVTGRSNNQTYYDLVKVILPDNHEDDFEFDDNDNVVEQEDTSTSRFREIDK